MTVRTRRVAAAAAAAAATMLAAALPSLAPLRAQHVRITGTTWVQSIDLRPLRADSVPVAEAIGDGPFRTTASGLAVRCADGAAFCRFNGSGPRATTTPLLQDVDVAAWGLGEGISFHAQARARSSL